MERTSIQVLEGDGILEDFYQLLWIRDPMFGTSSFFDFLALNPW